MAEGLQRGTGSQGTGQVLSSGRGACAPGKLWDYGHTARQSAESREGAESHVSTLQQQDERTDTEAPALPWRPCARAPALRYRPWPDCPAGHGERGCARTLPPSLSRALLPVSVSGGPALLGQPASVRLGRETHLAGRLQAVRVLSAARGPAYLLYAADHPQGSIQNERGVLREGGKRVQL